MKKFFAAAVLLTVCLAVTSCGEKNSLPEDTSAIEQYIAEFSETMRTEETTAVTTASETEKVREGETTSATSETAAAKREYMKNEEYLIGFLSYLQHKGYVEGETNYFAFDQGEDFSDYDFMDDFKIDSYSYQHRGDGIYDVKLTCSESTCDLFPNGDSYWVYGHGFYPAERENKILFERDMYDVAEPLKTAFFASVDFSLYTWEFEADEEWFESYTDISVHGFYHAYNPYVVINDYSEGIFYDVTPEEFAAAVKKLYNLNMTAEQARIMADESGFMVKDCGHGGSWLYDAFAGYEETDSEIKVRVDYYGDSMYFYPVIESEYTFSKNDNGTITLQKVEKIFDTGYKYASGTV